MKVLILTVFCAMSAHATPTLDLGAILSPLINGKKGILAGAQSGIDKHFAKKISTLDGFASKLSSFGAGAATSSGGSQGLSSDFGVDNSFNSAGSSAFESSSSGFESSYSSSSADSQGYNYLPPPAPPVNNGYVYERPVGGVSSQGSSITSGSSASGSASGLSGGFGGGLGGGHANNFGADFQNIIKAIGKIPVSILTEKKRLINGHLDKKIDKFSKFGGK